MDETRFRATVARLEASSRAHPRAYLVRVALLAGVGFALLALLLGIAGFGLALLAGVAIAALLTGGSALVLLLKFGKLLVLLAVPLWFLVRQSLKALFVRLPAPQGREVSRADAPALFAAIDRMRATLRGPKVHHVLLVDEVNAAIVQRPAFGLVGFPRNYLLLGLPLLESMTPDEALAVVAHEYGHLAGSHGRFGAFIYRLRHTWSTIQGIAAQWQGFAGRLLGRAVAWYAPYFNAYTFVLARSNEYQADRAAADLVGAGTVAAALKRVNVAGPQYQAFIGDTFARIGDSPEPPPDLSQRWASAALAPDAPAARWLAEALDRPGHVADTHPVLRDRLAALAVADAAVPPPLPAHTAAAEWLGAALPALREHFQRHWADAVARPWAEQHEAILARRARLAALRAMAGRSAEEDFERLRLATELEPATDWRDDLAAFNAVHADHAPALYLEGRLRLDRDDDAGVALIERAMALDGDAIKPGCERLHAHFRARRDEARAEACAERWRERDRFEAVRGHQANTLDPGHELQSPPPALAAAVREHAARLPRKGIAALYFARRVLPADPSLPSYVLGVRTTWWARRLGRQPKLLQQLTQAEWPLEMLVCTLEGRFARLHKRLKALPGAQVLP